MKQNLNDKLSYMPMVLVLLGILYINLHKTVQTLTVEAQSIPSVMHYSAVVNPLEVYAAVSPVQGVVTKVLVEYGSWVKDGEGLYIVESTDLADNFRQSIEDLFRAKADYQNRLFQHNGNTELYKLGLMSKVSYMDDTGQLENSELALYEAKQKLVKLLAFSGQKNMDLDSLAMKNVAELREFLKKPLMHLQVTAPHKGVLLFPSQSFASISGGSDAVKMGQGSQVKAGQTMAVIGNMSGLFFEIAVNETDFHKLKIGQVATITGTAFEGVTLQGAIEEISRQANSSDGSTTPLYSVKIRVPHLTEREKQIIQVGMSAEVTFTKQNPPTIRVPIDALTEKDGGYWAQKIDKKGKVQEVAVTTGITDESSVQIITGLSPGDKIVIPN